jgi:decaprenylphospho-beta-D-ribofuranose 2-oxidase
LFAQDPSVATPAHVTGWGGGEPAPVRIVRPDGEHDFKAVMNGLDDWSVSGAIARGLGRSYGDAAQMTGGFVLDMTRCARFELDLGAGTVTAQAGATIRSLLAAAIPLGWMLPVVPGTQHVTVGGAIASDIHGKNHGIAGTFGSHVHALGLLTGTGETVECNPGSPLFGATVGGMGLTGVILWARVALIPVSSAAMVVDSDRGEDLDEVLAILTEPGGAYRVAWLDLLGPRPRGTVTRAAHAPADAVPTYFRAQPTVQARATVPDRWPEGVLRTSTVRAFNELRYRRTPKRRRGRLEALSHHLFPLDVLDAWPRLYGRHGFVQYQLVVPAGEHRVLEAVIGELRAARLPCFLAVLKDFGPANDAPLSFPIPGWTLTLDIPRAAPRLCEVLDRCDELVAAAGGRVYLTKDARLRPEMVRAMYPRLAEWRRVRDGADPTGVWRSDLGLRAGLVAP